MAIKNKLILLVVFIGRCSFAQVQQDGFIKQIIDLPNQAEVPSYIYHQYSSEKIANSIVERIREKRDFNSNFQPYFDFKDNTKILLQFEEKYITSIQENCFLNLHQTGGGNGANEPEMRAKIEDENAGLKLEKVYVPGPENIVNELRPKYAYVQFTKSKPGLTQSKFWVSYGNVFAVLKDEIKQRSTFTAGDSFGNVALHGHAHSFDWHGSKSDRVEPYWEAQIWGKLCFGDVDYFLVNCPTMKPITQTGMIELKRVGKPIVDCQVNEAGALMPFNP